MDRELDKKTYKHDFNKYPTTMVWEDSPLVMERIGFSKRQRIAMQLTFTFVMIAALYSAFYAVDPILNGTGSTGHPFPSDAKVSGWFYILIPILAIIPGIYTFLFLKYNFNKNGLVFKKEKPEKIPQ